MGHSDANIKLKPLHMGVSVSDMETSIQWYQNVLGFQLERSTYMAPLKSKVAFLRLGDFSVELFRPDEVIPLPEERRIPNEDIKTNGTKHIAFLVKDMDALFKDLSEKKVDFATAVFGVNNNKVLFIRDNTGNLIEFIQTD